MDRATQAGTVVIIEGFNYWDIHFGYGSVSTAKGRKYLNFLQGNFFGPVCERPNKKWFLLYLVISNNAQLVRYIAVREKLGDSDYNIIVNSKKKTG